MAGRGCVIKVQITRNAAETSSPEEISLQVALHSPLEVLKLQLQQMTRISLQSQVLILLDLSDADRNSDRLLEHEQNHITLRNLGIRQNSVLSLHSLGAMKNDATAEEVDSSDGVKEKVFSLSTLIPASRADHSYNGVIFNIASKGAFEVTIKSIHLAGMLSMVRIFARDRAWDMRRDDEAPSFSGHWWAHRENVSSQGWKEVAAQVCSPSWDRPTEIKFHTPVTLLPHEVLGFYCHSALPDDLGIQYQSFVKDGVVAEDDVIRVTPGVGHTGSVPFDETNGWYRAYRGPAGSFSYTCRLKGWSPFTHKIFPQPFRHSVKELLLVNNRVCKQNLLSSLPPFVLYYIMEFAHWDWFCEAAGNRKLLGHSRVTPNSAAPTTGSRRYSTGVASQLYSMIDSMIGGGVNSDDDEEDEDYGESEEDDASYLEETSEVDGNFAVEPEGSFTLAHHDDDMESDDDEDEDESESDGSSLEAAEGGAENLEETL